MALEKEKELASGLSAKYWRIHSIESKYFRPTTSPGAADSKVFVALFVSQEARNSDKTPVLLLPIEVDGFIASVEEAYKVIKKLPEFEGALDV